MENTQIIQKNETELFVSPVISIEEAKTKFNTVRKFTADCLIEGTDYGKYAGVEKPSLLKPGAEKIGSLFGLSPKFERIDRILNWNGEGNPDHEPFFYFEYRCNLYRGEQFIGSCDASCNSWEKKYRYRKAEIKCPDCGKSAIIKGKKEFGGGWVCFTKKGGCGHKFQDTDSRIISQATDNVKNFDTAEQVNTYQKMAQKRAYIGAILIACNLSEYFTQDIEDMDETQIQMNQLNTDPIPEPVYIEGEYSPIEPQNQNKEEFNEEEFLKNFAPPEDFPFIAPAKANAEIDSNGQRYEDIPTQELRYRINTLHKYMNKKDQTDERKQEARYKLAIIYSVLSDRKAKKMVKPIDKSDPFVN